MKGTRLLVVVPYRDREAHMRQFVPHLRAFFARDAVARAIEYRVMVVEQEPGLPFNAGLLRNAGFVLDCANCDYTCFNDVDYLPIWADYSWSDLPTPLVWYGAEQRPVAPGESNVVLKHDPDQIFGGVVLVPNDSFRQVNGYSNAYWGWGYEDQDLKMRFTRAGIATGRRRGTFHALGHRNAGHELDGRPNEVAAVNRDLFQRKWENPRPEDDGLTAIRFEILDRHPITGSSDPEREMHWERVLIRPLLAPTPEQVEAARAVVDRKQQAR